VEVFSGFEAHGAAGRDADFGSGARVAADAGFAGTNVEDAEPAKLDAVSFSERSLQAFKHCFDGGLGFYAGQSGTLNYLMYDVLLNQWLPPKHGCEDGISAVQTMLERIFRIVNV
jgi:hypothetical protein